MRSGGSKGPHLSVTLCFLRGGLRAAEERAVEAGRRKAACCDETSSCARSHAGDDGPDGSAEELERRTGGERVEETAAEQERESLREANRATTDVARNLGKSGMICRWNERQG